MECPTCGRDDFASKRAMRIHHTAAHGETLGKKTLECDHCGQNYEEFKSRTDRSRFCSEECKNAWQSENWTDENNPRGSKHPTLICEHCGEEYTVIPARREKSRFCSSECLDKWRSEYRSGSDAYAWEGGTIQITCKYCSQEFSVKQARKDTAQFCSRDCKAEWQTENLVGNRNPSWQGGGIRLECEYCETKYEIKESEADTSRFCSHKCLSQWQSENWTGEDAPAWKGGRYGYYGPSWQHQRQRALERDDHRCVICGDTEVEVHHIRPFRTFGLENHNKANQLENLICLCPDHHRKWEGIPLRPDTKKR